MKVAAYVHVRRSRLDLNPTGVGKHINAMVPGLARVPGIDLSVLGPHEDLQPDGSWPTTTPLAHLPLRAVSWSRRWTEAGWSLWRWPKAERWTGNVDWVYCPAEAFVATRAAKLAVTVHCVNWFEPELPWYDDPDTRQLRRSLGWRFRRFRRYTELLLPVSQFLAGRLTALFGIPPEKMRIVGNGVEEEYFAPKPLAERWLKHIAGRPYLLVVGGLTRRKGGDCILEVARALRRRKCDLQILLAGTGEPQFAEPAAELPNIRSLGYVGVEDGLPALLHHSTALLFPSRFETFGIPAAEALAAGTPAIVAHYGALPEVVGDAGVVVDPHQPEAIAEIADNLARDVALRAKYVAAGRVRAQQFHWQACVDRAATALREFS